jgi:hypothetical protein
MNIFSIKRTKDDDMTGVNTITKKALHHLIGHCVVSMQEGVHMVDDQELVICSDSMTYVSITQGQVLQDNTESDKKQDIITVYRNRTKKYRDLFLKQFFYRVFFNTTLKKSNSGDSDDNDGRDAVTNSEH